MPAKAARTKAAPYAQYKTIYFRDLADLKKIQERAKAAGMSVSEYVIEAALGKLQTNPELEARLRLSEEDGKYWRQRFEQMAGLAQDTQAEVLQLRAEMRTRASGIGGGGATAEAPDAAASQLAPRLIVVFTSLRSADGKYRVWTEQELLDELGLARDIAGAEHLRNALATLYRTNLIEPQRNGWRYRQ